jgi:hypothetical protein
MGVGDSFGFYMYTSDDTTAYGVKLSAAVATAGGFSDPAAPGSDKMWPFESRNMRHVLGKDGSGHRTRLPIAENDDTKYVSGGTFTLGARTYTIEGIVGEKRLLSVVG